jgi:hypothetical protein
MRSDSGQVALPGIGPLVKGSVVPRKWAAEHTELAPNRHLVVSTSTGIGMEPGPGISLF